MKRLLATLLSAALLAAPLFAQQNDEEQKALQRQIRIQNLQSQLEDLRRKRDKMVVDRWEERRAANEKRENLNRKIDEARSALEQAGERKSRLMDDIRAVQGEVAQGQQSVESSRARFLSLSEQSGKLQELRQLAAGRNVDHGVTFRNACAGIVGGGTEGDHFRHDEGGKHDKRQHEREETSAKVLFGFFHNFLLSFQETFELWKNDWGIRDLYKQDLCGWGARVRP